MSSKTHIPFRFDRQICLLSKFRLTGPLETAARAGVGGSQLKGSLDGIYVEGGHTVVILLLTTEASGVSGVVEISVDLGPGFSVVTNEVYVRAVTEI